MVKNVQIDLICLCTRRSFPNWPLGDIFQVEPMPSPVHQLIQQSLHTSSADYWLFWNPSLGNPDPDVIIKIISLPGDVWHAGLRLGTAGLIDWIDFVAPTWMLNRDPDPDIISTSWRISLDACLIRMDVLRKQGGIFPEFDSLMISALEMGHRYISHGVFVRYVPYLAPLNFRLPAPQIAPADKMRFIYYRFNLVQFYWSMFRAFTTRSCSLVELLKAYPNVVKSPPPVTDENYENSNGTQRELAEIAPKVSVLIPTVDRYSYLRVVLNQLSQQTISPLEVIVIDQTSQEERDLNLRDEFPNLPLKLIYLGFAGQSTARNIGLQAAQGEYILFIDDDDEIEDDLIERHLINLEQALASVSSGLAIEPEAGPIPELFKRRRISDIFPTNNTLVRREILKKSGLFDVAFDQGQQADGDLGMRIYLSGALMVYDPSIRVLHHHASRGGLRVHKARVVTTGRSRYSLFLRRLPHRTEIYLFRRYFTSRQVKEQILLSIRSTFVIRGKLGRRLTKFGISLILLPNTLWRIHKRYQESTQMLMMYPEILYLDK